MKKIFLVVLCISLMLSLFACVSDSDKNNTNDIVPGNTDDDNKNDDIVQGDEKEVGEEIYANVVDQLKRSDMSASVYSEVQIDGLEQRFNKIGVADKMQKVTHFRSMTEYAYVILFSDIQTAEAFYERLSQPGSGIKDITKTDCVVIYGDSDDIAKIEIK